MLHQIHIYVLNFIVQVHLSCAFSQFDTTEKISSSIVIGWEQASLI